MDWNELAEKISKMTPEQRNQPVLTFDNNEGEFCEVSLEYWVVFGGFNESRRVCGSSLITRDDGRGGSLAHDPDGAKLQ